jgi:hypothetical protein
MMYIGKRSLMMVVKWLAEQSAYMYQQVTLVSKA